MLTQNRGQISGEYIPGRKEYPGDVIFSVCEALAERTFSKTDAAGIYRYYLETMKKDL